MANQSLYGMTVETQFAAIAHTSSPTNGAWIDTAGYSHFLFVIQMGNLAAGAFPQTVDFKLQYSADGTTLGGDIPNSSIAQLADGNDNEERSIMLHMDASPGRYIRATCTQANNPAFTVVGIGFPREYVASETITNSNGRAHPTNRITP